MGMNFSTAVYSISGIIEGVNLNPTVIQTLQSDKTKMSPEKLIGLLAPEMGIVLDDLLILNINEYYEEYGQPDMDMISIIYRYYYPEYNSVELFDMELPGKVVTRYDSGTPFDELVEKLELDLIPTDEEDWDDD